MSKLNIDQQSIKDLFMNRSTDFLIPDYQRPYAWEENECQTLWDDIFTFAFPDSDYSKFDSDNDEYFLGPIVTFKNENKKLEIIDGQQRLTTFMLLLRAFYTRFKNMKDENSNKMRDIIAKCIWKTDEFENPNINQLKIDSEVSTDDDKDEFLTILKTGEIEQNYKSRYAENFKFFQEKINDFLGKYPSYFSYLPARILNNCILLPIEAESQDTALRIFSTLNDRGKPLSDGDIFKAQFYKYFSEKLKKDEFIERWKKLEEKANKIFSSNKDTAIDELFTRYMYYERAKQGNRKTTTEALRKFYEKNKYELLRKEETFTNLELLLDFWNSVSRQDEDIFSHEVLSALFILNYAPNGMWTYITSVYFLKNRDENGKLEDNKFLNFLNKMIGFIWTYAILRPGVNALRTPAYPEMIKIVNGDELNFREYKFEKDIVKEELSKYTFTNGRPITKSMLAWWTYYNKKQELWTYDDKLEIEHIFAKKRQEIEKTLKDYKKIESLGNKALLEKNINIRASDYRFSDKKKYYKGYEKSNGIFKRATLNSELLNFSNSKEDFIEKDIIERETLIINEFISYLAKYDLLKE